MQLDYSSLSRQAPSAIPDLYITRPPISWTGPARIERAAPLGGNEFGARMPPPAGSARSRTSTIGGASTTPYPTPPSSNSTRAASPLGENPGPSNARGEVANPLYNGGREQAHPLFGDAGIGPLDFGPGDPPRVFTVAELAAATEGFNARHLLGSSGFGRTYFCVLGGKTVVVKRLHELQVRAASKVVASLGARKVFAAFVSW